MVYILMLLIHIVILWVSEYHQTQFSKSNSLLFQLNFKIMISDWFVCLYNNFLSWNPVIKTFFKILYNVHSLQMRNEPPALLWWLKWIQRHIIDESTLGRVFNFLMTYMHIHEITLPFLAKNVEDKSGKPEKFIMHFTKAFLWLKWW